MASIFTSATLVNSENSPIWSTTPVTIVTAGTPVQGADLSIPANFDVLIFSPRSNGNKRIFVANSSPNTAIANNRVELRSGESFNLRIDNTNLLWFDASANAAVAQVIVEA